MKVYVVGDHGPEHNSIRSIHKTYIGALKAWNALRTGLLDESKHSLKKSDSKYEKELYSEIIKNLSCNNPKKIDNFPQETPYIKEYHIKT